jgi:hypothetical protein|nr:MAG TPA: hypothetical protein [Caudoviricetes sp.]
MDAVKFIEGWNRMLKVEGKAPCIEFCTTRTPEETVFSVEEWSAAHPNKTRQSVFLEQYPESSLDEYGVLRLCPSDISADYRDGGGCRWPELMCSDCRREFWMQEVE